MPPPVKRRFQSQAWKAAWPDLLAFALGLAIAWGFHWKTSDLVWSLWLGSLTLGYLTFFSTVIAGAWIGFLVITRPDFPAKRRWPAALGGSAVALFLLGFFSLHFGAFHSIHAGFVAIFFPLADVPPEAFFDCFLNPFRLLATAFRHVAPLYGAFLLPAVIAERNQVFAAVGTALLVAQENRPGLEWTKRFSAGAADDFKRHNPFTRPYVNVIRLHLLIFFFAACHALQIESFPVFAVVYAVYFFPWKAFFPKVPDAPA